MKLIIFHFSSAPLYFPLVSLNRLLTTLFLTHSLNNLSLYLLLNATEQVLRTNNKKQRYSCLHFNPLNPELNPICYLLALLGAHYFLHVSRIRVKLLTFRLLMSCIYGAPILDVSRSHTTTQYSR